jgi:CheY-like chemotaxis protein
MPEVGTVLLAEDNADDVLLIQIAYANAGIRQRLEVVSNGRQAIRYLSGQAPYADRAAHPFPTLLLLDLKMPAHDGFEVLQWLCQHPDVQRLLPTVVLTGHPSPQMVARARELGARGVLIKSVAFADLEASMRQLKQGWLDGVPREKPHAA